MLLSQAKKEEKKLMAIKTKIEINIFLPPKIIFFLEIINSKIQKTKAKPKKISKA